MKIKTNLILLSLAFLILIIIIGFVTAMNFYRISRELEYYDNANKMMRDMSELGIVTHEYFMYQEKRMRQQWFLKYDSIAKGLEMIGERGERPEPLLALELISSDHKILGDLFSQLEANAVKRKRLIEENRPQAEIDANLFSGERLTAHALLRAQKITSEAFNFSASIHEEVNHVQRKAGFIVLLSIIGFAIFASYILFFVTRAITRPLNELVEGAERIGKGDLGHRVKIRTKDEIGGLAVAFNQMTESLKKVTASRDELDKEISGRKRTEEESKALNQQLQANEGELYAEIIERKKTEEEIKHAAQEWRITFDSIASMISIHGIDYKIIRVNKAFADAFKMHPKDIIGKTCYKLIHGAKKPWPDCPHKKAMETKKPVRMDFFEPHLGIVLEVFVSPIFNEKNEVIATVHIAENITERRKADEELKDLGERMKILFEYAPDAIYLCDLRGNFIDGNRMAEETIGYKKEELIGKSFLKLNLLSPHQVPKAAASLAKSVIGKATESEEFTLNKKDGEKTIVEIRTFPIKIKDEAFILGIARDITERKKIEEDARKHLTELEVFYKASLGREARIIELKKEIEAFKKRLARQEK